MTRRLLPPVARAQAHAARPALIAADGRWTYADLLHASAAVAARLLGHGADLAEARVAFLVSPSCAHVAVQWGIWRAGGVAVPLCTSHPAPELGYVIDDAQASVLIADAGLAPKLRPLADERGIPLLTVESDLRVARGGGGDPPPGDESRLPHVDADRRAMILYTSGTTGRPKGVVSTHALLTAQVDSVVDAWGWTASDHVLHVLPLHHLHGILNLLCCPLAVGATCEMQDGFDAARVWARLAADDPLTVFMAVPTIYSRLRAVWDAAPPDARQRMSAGCRRLRLMVSGSAALPIELFEHWRALSGHALLERYGMTEIGMALGNPIDGERVPGSVGMPFPRVQVRLVDDAGAPIADGEAGELQVRGPTVFREYWRRPDETRAAFAADGWFRTGDVAVREHGRHRLLGRASVDIIKTGGFKVSALEIENVLRAHDAIVECAVVGVADPEWGQRVGVVVQLAPGHTLELESLRAWAKQRLAPYKVPTLLRIVDALPRNPMGKVTKPAVARLLGSALPGPE